MRRQSDEAFERLSVAIQDVGRARRDDVRRPAPGHRRQPRRDVGEQGRVHGRADGALGVVQTRNVLDLIGRVKARACRSC
jgi:hypothetical protein